MSAVKKYNRVHMEASFEHARELKFAEDFDTNLAEDFSKTANMFGDFYFSAATEKAKQLAAAVVNKELQEMRERLDWGALTPSKPIPKEEFQIQLSKSRFLSLFLVMRRITGKWQLAQKKKAFAQWIEWYKAFIILYRSRKHVRSRSSSPNRSVRTGTYSDASSIATGYSSRSHPRDYHFHGDRNKTPEQIRKELYLHKDVYLSSQDDTEAARALLHRVHPHASNHPERELKDAVQPLQGHKHSAVPSHIVPRQTKASVARRSRSVSPPGHRASSIKVDQKYHFHGTSNLSPHQVRKELWLHKDMFLSTTDDLAEALVHRAHPHSPNHPEQEYKSGFFAHQNEHRGSPVPSHVVPRRSPGSGPSQRARSVSPVGSRAKAEEKGYHFHGTNLSPKQLQKELYLHTDVFLTSDDDVARALLHKHHPHSPNHPEQAPMNKFASPKHRAKAAQSPARTRPASAGASAAASPGHSRASSPPPGTLKHAPHLLRRDLHLGHDMFLTSQDDDLAKLKLQKVKVKGPSCRGMDVIVGSRKDAHLVHKSDPVTHVKKVASGEHHSARGPATPRSITPSNYAAGVTSSGLKPFNVSKDKKHEKPKRLSASPSKVLSAEHAEVVGINVPHEELRRPGTPSRSLARALSILVTPTSDALSLGHKVTAEDHLKRTLSALSIAGHDEVIEAVKRTKSETDLSYSESENDPQEWDEGKEGDFTRTVSSATLNFDNPGIYRYNSRLSGMNLAQGLSIRTDQDMSVAGDTLRSSSASPSRRNSFHAPTVSHILKVAHKAESVEKVAAKVAEKRTTVRQQLPKSPHPNAKFEIIPDVLHEIRAERRTSFRSPTKSHEIKVAEKKGIRDIAEEITGLKHSDSMPEQRPRRRSFADTGSVVSNSTYNLREDDVIRTYIPFRKAGLGDATSPTHSIGSSVLAPSPDKLKRRGSLMPNSPVFSATGTSAGGKSTPTSGIKNDSSNVKRNESAQSVKAGAKASRGNSMKKGSRHGSGVKFDSQDDTTTYSDDEASVVYGVDDDLVNLFDLSSAKPTTSSSAAAATMSSSSNNLYSPGSTYTPSSKARRGSFNSTNILLKKALAASKQNLVDPEAGKEEALALAERNKKNKVLNTMCVWLKSLKEKHGKITTAASAFRIWRASTLWFRRISERVPQSVLYLLQVEREILWRVFCVYCQDKQRIPVSPPSTAVTAVLSPDQVERLTSGYSAHHDHHTHAPAVLHKYVDIHDHSNVKHQKDNIKQLKKDAYLHHDIFLNSSDTDLAELALLKAHKHAANHYEEGIVVHHEVNHKPEAPIVHHHDAFVAHPHQHKVNKTQTHKDTYLNHDIFLSTNDDDIYEVTVKNNHKHAPNHPEEGVIVTETGGVKRPPKILIPAPHSPVPESTTLPPRTPLYGLFTVIEDHEDDELNQSGESNSRSHSNNNSHGGSPVPKLNYGANDGNEGSHRDNSGYDEDSPEMKQSAPEDKSAPHTAPKKEKKLEILTPTITAVTTTTPNEIIQQHASTRFKKKLLCVDGLWQLFLDFNVVPYLFNKHKLSEMFEHSLNSAPLALDTTQTNNLVVWELNPLMNLPAFNVYSQEAPEKLEDAPWQPRSRSNSINRSRSNSISPVRVRGESASEFSTPGQVNTSSTLSTSGVEAAKVNSAYHTPNGAKKSNTSTPSKTPAGARSTKTTPTTGNLHNTPSSTPSANERRPSSTSGISTTSVGSAAQRRMNRMLETLSGNGARRAFTSPDGKATIKLTAFSPPSSIDVKETYIGNVTNPRSKSPAVIRQLKNKKKEDDDYAKAIVEANRKALQDKAEMEKNARRKNSSAAAHIKHPAMYKSVLNVENKLSGRATSPYRSPNKSPSKNNTQNSSFSPNSGDGGHNIFKGNGVSSSVGELELFHVGLSSPAKVVEMISFHSFVRLLWETAAGYMDIEKDDEAGISALKAFVFTMHRYHARMVTKEVEKVLPLLEHDENIRHRALKLL